MATRDQTDDSEEFFLPDFCGLQAVLAVVVLMELFAFVLTLASTAYHKDLVGLLAMNSLFVQWAGLTSAAALCFSKRFLARMHATLAGVVSYLMLLLLIGLLSLFAHVTMEFTGFPNAITGRFEFVLRNLGIAAIVCALTLRYFYVTHQWRRRTRAEARARLEALQARIRPHFLFNSINTVTSLIHTRPDDAEEALLDMADLFRAGLREGQRFIPLHEELALTRRYLNMEQLRLGERLRLEWHEDDGVQDVLLPPLIIQPLVENAVYHGIEPRPEGGVVSLSVISTERDVRIIVTNPLADPALDRNEGNKIALQNIRDRIAALYDERASMVVDEGECSFQVRLILPREEGV